MLCRITVVVVYMCIHLTAIMLNNWACV